MILTNREKYKLLAKEPEQIKNFFSDELFKIGGISLNDEQLDNLEKAFIDSITIEFEESKENENVRTSLKILDDEIVVIKTKKLSIKEFISAVMAIGSIATRSNALVVIATLLNLISVLFITKLNDDEKEIYTYLAYLYFEKNNKISNAKIYEIIKSYYRELLEETISDRKINLALKRLEEDLRVIEFVDGYLIVKDKIYYQ